LKKRLEHKTPYRKRKSGREKISPNTSKRWGNKTFSLHIDEERREL